MIKTLERRQDKIDLRHLAPELWASFYQRTSHLPLLNLTTQLFLSLFYELTGRCSMSILTVPMYFEILQIQMQFIIKICQYA